MNSNNEYSKEKHYRQMADVLEDMGVSRPTLRKWAREAGAYFNMGGTVLIDMDKLSEYIEKHRWKS